MKPAYLWLLLVTQCLVTLGHLWLSLVTNFSYLSVRFDFPLHFLLFTPLKCLRLVPVGLLSISVVFPLSTNNHLIAHVSYLKIILIEIENIKMILFLQLMNFIIVKCVSRKVKVFKMNFKEFYLFSFTVWKNHQKSNLYQIRCRYW